MHKARGTEMSGKQGHRSLVRNIYIASIKTEREEDWVLSRINDRKIESNTLPAAGWPKFCFS